MQGILSDIDVLVQIALGAEFHLNWTKNTF